MTAPAVVTPTASVAPAPSASVETPTQGALTTPVIEQAPIVEAPAESTEPQGRENVQNVIDRITRREIPAEVGEPGVEGEASAETAPVIDPAANAPAAPAAMVTEISADDGDGETLLRARDADGKFSPMDQTKKYELIMKDKQSGETKIYEKTLPDLMRLAKDGIAMQKSRDELSFYRTKVPEWQQSHSQLQQQADGFRSLALELLTADESQVIARREQYAQELTPEKELARLKQQIAQTDQRRANDAAHTQQAQRTAQAQQQVQALASRIGPVIAEVEGLVGKQAAAGDLALFTAPLMVNGQVPLEHFAKVEAYIQGPYRAWAQAEAAKRTTQTTEAQRQLAAAQDAQRRAQIGVRTAGSATRPIGGNGPAAGQTAQPKPPARGVQDVINNIVRKPMAQSA